LKYTSPENSFAKVEEEEFKLQETVCKNLKIVVGGTAETTDTILIGAHYDSTSENPTQLAPGAVDNASGTVGVLYVLEYFLANRPKLNLHLMLFAGNQF
jgi:Zn-dependent M28 family amino/carboxypeptidase